MKRMKRVERGNKMEEIVDLLSEEKMDDQADETHENCNSQSPMNCSFIIYLKDPY